MPMDPGAIRAALDHDEPAIALAVALVAVHALTNQQVRGLKLTDIVDGRLTLPDGRNFPLAGPARVRLAAWLDYRAATWPRTLNTHLFVTKQTGPRLLPPGHNFPWKRANLSPRALRTDRILQEIDDSGGDVRRICDLFGIGVEAAMHYALAYRPDPEDAGHPDRHATGSSNSAHK